MNITTLSKISAIITKCNFHTSTCYQVKPEKVMRKVMGLSSKKRKNFSEAGILPSANMFSKGSLEGRFSGNARRTSVLNKLFMRYITDIMATGEYSSEFVGHGIEINRVQITPDYKGLNVFWIAKGTPDDEVIEKLLKKNAGFLRHELSTLRVVGVVPTIYFVKDKKYCQVIEVDSRLSKADFGEDHVPLELGSKLKTQLELYTPLPNDIKDKIKEIDSSQCEDDVHDEEPLPPMPQDVLGLNHADILNRIKKNMKRSEATHRYDKNSQPYMGQTINENPIQFTSNKEQRAVFKDFLAKRELLRTKARKEEKKYVADVEYMKEEFLREQSDYFKNMDIYEEDRDYVIDEDEENENKS